MTLLDVSDIRHLEDILDNIRDLASIMEKNPNITIHQAKGLDTNIEWLHQLIELQPITQLQRDLRNAIGAQYEADAIAEVVKNDLLLAKAGIDGLKHLQKYEGMQKIESDIEGSKATEAMLRAKIAEQAAELEALRK